MGRSAATLIALGGVLPARRGDARPRFRDDPFSLGVASGDPHPDGVVLWTRLEGAVARSDADPAARVPVRWEIAEDEGFRRIVRAGDQLALPELGHSVHAEVGGLRPGRVYHYRFLAGGVESPVGRTRTAPPPGAASDRLRFAFASCQNHEHGFYTAYRHMAQEDLDLVVHLGDYIYEGRSEEGRMRPHGRGEAFTLQEYRARHRLYRTDPDLQAAHAAFPWVVTWDDHDVENNYADGIPERGQDPGAFVLRRAAAYQAYYEFLPLRRGSVPRGPEMGMYRRLAFGDLLAMHVLDSRQYRDDQACGDRIKPACEARGEPGRTLLGVEQERWLERGLRGSGARWNVLAQQVVMAPLEYRTRDGETAWSMDSWDGYPVARQRLLDVLSGNAVANPVVLTGDIHSSWVMDLHARPELPDSPVVGTELVGTSIATGGDGRDAEEEEPGMNARNPHVRFFNDRRGYVRCDVTGDRLTARYRAVPWITRPDAPLQTPATFVIENGRPGAQRDSVEGRP